MTKRTATIHAIGVETGKKLVFWIKTRWSGWTMETDLMISTVDLLWQETLIVKLMGKRDLKI